MRPIHLVLMSCVALAACGPRPYEGFREQGFDPQPGELTGRVIVLDPGHGGRYPGAIASDGTREADVNLAVAQELARLLQAAGASVVLTRTGDYDLHVDENDAPLRRELEERVALSDRIRPDLFLSIHHNSRPGKVGRFNRIETYHRMFDEGPSLDAARRIHQHLCANLGIPEQTLVPGNYLVLRHNNAPAVLGEASYLTSRGMGRRLSKVESQRIEARAYFAGILDYLRRGIPRLESESSSTPWIMPPRGSLPRIENRAASQDPGAPPLDPQSIRVTLDGQPIDHYFDGSIIHPLPLEPLRPGHHEMRVAVRNLLGNASAAHVTEIQVVAPVAAISIRSSTDHVPGPGPFPLELSLTTADGAPVADGSTVECTVEGGTIVAGPTPTVDGTAILWITTTGPEVQITAIAGDVRSHISIGFDTEIHRQGILVSVENEPVVGALIVGAGTVVGQTDVLGRTLLLPTPEGTRLSVIQRGYRTVEIAVGDSDSTDFLDVQLAPLLPDLMGRSFVIDPAVGGDDQGVSNALGTSEAPINLSVAQMLADYLRRAGAHAALTRDTWESASGVERVATEGAIPPTLFVTIQHRGDSVAVAHYPSSTRGKDAAERVAEELSLAIGAPSIAKPGADFTLLMTRAAAIVVAMPGPLSSTVQQTNLSEPWYQRLEAWAIFRAIVRHVDGGEGNRPTSDRIRISDKSGRALGRSLVTLDDHFPLQTDPHGWLWGALLPGATEATILPAGAPMDSTSTPRPDTSQPSP